MFVGAVNSSLYLLVLFAARLTFSSLFHFDRQIFFFPPNYSIFFSSQLNRWFKFSEISLSTAQPKHMYQYKLIWFVFPPQSLDTRLFLFFFFYFFDRFRYIAKTSHTHFILYERHKSTKKKKVLWFIGIFPFAAFQIHKISFTSSEK